MRQQQRRHDQHTNTHTLTQRETAWKMCAFTHNQHNSLHTPFNTSLNTTLTSSPLFSYTKTTSHARYFTPCHPSDKLILFPEHLHNTHTQCQIAHNHRIREYGGAAGGGMQTTTKTIHKRTNMHKIQIIKTYLFLVTDVVTYAQSYSLTCLPCCLTKLNW